MSRRTERVMVRRNVGVLTVLAFAFVVAAIGVYAGSTLMGLGLGSLLVIGSTLVAAEGEPLAARSAVMMGTVHVLAITLLTL